MPDDYDVGYKKPPIKTQWKKGQSGNLKGRPKGTKNLRTALKEELQEKIVVREGGQKKTITKQCATVKGLVSKAMKGDVRAFNAISNQLKTDEEKEEQVIQIVVDEQDMKCM